MKKKNPNSSQPLNKWNPWFFTTNPTAKINFLTTIISPHRCRSLKSPPTMIPYAHPHRIKTLIHLIPSLNHLHMPTPSSDPSTVKITVQKLTATISLQLRLLRPDLITFGSRFRIRRRRKSCRIRLFPGEILILHT